MAREGFLVKERALWICKTAGKGFLVKERAL
jgi:hypothetical protein